MSKLQLPAIRQKKRPWNKGRLVGQKRPLQPKQVWPIRARPELAGDLRDLALFNLAIDSKLRGCDLVRPGGVSRSPSNTGQWTTSRAVEATSP